MNVIGLALVAAVCDVLWLVIVAPSFQKIVNDIQTDRAMKIRMWAAIPIYLAIGYLVSRADSIGEAFIFGVCAYAIYDFTQIFAFDRYPIGFALADVVWGGVLFSLVKTLTHAY